jgi:hypothetical protein
VHQWLLRYADGNGLDRLADRHRDWRRCLHQLPATVETRFAAM